MVMAAGPGTQPQSGASTETMSQWLIGYQHPTATIRIAEAPIRKETIWRARMGSQGRPRQSEPLPRGERTPSPLQKRKVRTIVPAQPHADPPQNGAEEAHQPKATNRPESGSHGAPSYPTRPVPPLASTVVHLHRTEGGAFRGPQRRHPADLWGENLGHLLGSGPEYPGVSPTRTEVPHACERGHPRLGLRTWECSGRRPPGPR